MLQPDYTRTRGASAAMAVQSAARGRQARRGLHERGAYMDEPGDEYGLLHPLPPPPEEELSELRESAAEARARRRRYEDDAV